MSEETFSSILTVGRFQFRSLCRKCKQCLHTLCTIVGKGWRRIAAKSDRSRLVVCIRIVSATDDNIAHIARSPCTNDTASGNGFLLITTSIRISIVSFRKKNIKLQNQLPRRCALKACANCAAIAMHTARKNIALIRDITANLVLFAGWKYINFKVSI